jgi:hypothetical protein
MISIDQLVIYVRTVQNCERIVEIITATDKVRNADINEIAEWFSNNDSQTYIQFDRENIFFHPLPYGDFALGIINPVINSAADLSADNSADRDISFSLNLSKSFFVRVLIITAEVLFLHANNPISIYEKLRSNRKIDFIAEPPIKLRPLNISTKQTICDTNILTRVASESGTVAVVRLFQSLFDSVCTIFRPCNSTPLLILNGIFNLLPIRFRSNLTFSTELFLSPITPLSAVGFCGDSQIAIRLSKDSGVPLVDFDRFSHYKTPPQNVYLGQWTQLVLRILTNKDFDFWEYQIKSDTELNEKNNETEDVIDWYELNGLAIIWQRNYHKKPVIKRTCSGKIVESAERELEQSITAVEKLIAETKCKYS